MYYIHTDQSVQIGHTIFHPWPDFKLSGIATSVPARLRQLLTQSDPIASTWRSAIPQAVRIMRQGWRFVLRERGWTPKLSTLRILRKVDAATIHPSRLSHLKLQLKDPRKARLIRHLKRINGCTIDTLHLPSYTLRDESDYRNKIKDGLKQFSTAVRTLSEEEQRELIQRVIDGITVLPAPNERNGPIRNPGQRVLIEIHLRMSSLVNTESQKARKLKVKLDVTLNRGKALWALTTGDVPLEVRRPEPSRSKKKPPPETRKHEIHRADHIRRTMEKQGWSAAEYARKEGITRSAVSQVLRWYKLSSDCQNYLRNLTDPKLVRACSHRLRRKLEKHPPVEQLSVLLASVKNGPEKR